MTLNHVNQRRINTIRYYCYLKLLLSLFSSISPGTCAAHKGRVQLYCLQPSRRGMLCCSSADGNYEVTLMTKATVYCTGLVLWQPPAVYKSSCSIDVEFFPYDVQTCVLKLGSWTYDGFKVTMIMYRLAGKKKILPGSSI